MKTINVIDDKTIEVDGVVFVPRENPKYKIPAWYKWRSDSDCEIFRATSQNDYYLFSNVSNYPKRECFFATEDEVEKHLRKICDAKGYKKGMKVKDAIDGLISIITGNEPEEYRLNYDSLVIRSNGIDHDYTVTNLYYKGKFAEIFPDLKKKPETRKEHEEFITDFGEYVDRTFLTKDMDDFINQYSW